MPFHFGDADHWLIALGVFNVIWCVSLALYGVISVSRHTSSVLRAGTDSFATLLMARGDHLRRTGDIANAITRVPR